MAKSFTKFVKSALKTTLKATLPYRVRHTLRMHQAAKRPPSITAIPAIPANHVAPATGLSAGFPELWTERLRSDKLGLIDRAVRRFGPKSFADLSGSWHVDAGYSFYTLERHGLPHGVLVDFTITAPIRQRQRLHPGFELVTGALGSAEAVRQVGRVDMIFLYDVLLHQGAPDWDEILKMYAPLTSLFLIVNPQYAIPKTLRLLDCGRTGYFRHVPHTPDEREYRIVFDNLNRYAPDVRKLYRDSPAIWQWGITDADLIATMQSLGFQLDYFQIGEPFWPMPHVANHAFLFQKLAT